MKYSIDTSAIIDAFRYHYPLDVFPSVWQRVDELVASGDLCAVEIVLFELEKKDDEVHAWCKARRALFRPASEAIQGPRPTCLRSILTWRRPSRFGLEGTRSSLDWP